MIDIGPSDEALIPLVTHEIRDLRGYTMASISWRCLKELVAIDPAANEHWDAGHCVFCSAKCEHRQHSPFTVS